MTKKYKRDDYKLPQGKFIILIIINNCKNLESVIDLNLKWVYKNKKDKDLVKYYKESKVYK